MAYKFTAQAEGTLRDVVDKACIDGEHGLPGITAVVVSKDGELFAHSSGKRGYGSDEPITLDTIFWIASCTKMITAIACMQLVERGVLSLDDADQAEELAPYLKEVKVLDDDGKLVEKRNRITLRMLLTHTSGFGYTFFNEKLRDYSKPIGYDEFSGHIYDIKQPLVHHPGESWEYGVGIDWAGFLVEKVTNLSLNDYFQEHIFKPLGITKISMFPTEDMKSNLADMNYRDPNGQLHYNDHILRRPLIVETEEEKKSCVNSGGAGCFAKPQEYGQIISTLLNDGVSPHTGARILEKSTVDEMFKNQIPEFPNFGRKGIPDSKAWLTNKIPDIYPVGDAPQGWGLSWMVTGGATGRSSSTGFWAGLANLYWWADREKGVGGFVCSQILPFADGNVLGLWVNLEAAVYNALGLAK
ncbi:beta-lactamase/transpeptidase-like protein [Dipodascopsis uninucleata]